MRDTKRQNLPYTKLPTSLDLPADLPARPGLWVVATPIGNLGDLSSRARWALEAADVILCEDTRRTAKLLAVLGISVSLERLDAHASLQAINRIIERLKSGSSLALVTDAGTPGISDPGAVLISAARDAGVEVTPIPGASALLALLSASGFSEVAFAFCGFFPRKNAEKAEELRRVAACEVARVFIWFESPERILGTLQVISKNLPEVEVVAAKELTKIHERFFSGSSTNVASEVEQELKREGRRGEWCFAIRIKKERIQAGMMNIAAEESSDWVKALQCLLDVPLAASEAARRVSQYFGVSRKTVYEAALKISGKK